MKQISIIFLLIFAFSCTTHRVGINFCIKANPKLYQNQKTRILFDSISSRSMQLKSGNQRTLTFAHNFKIKNEYDTTYIEILEGRIIFKVDSSKIISRDSKVSLSVTQKLYFLSDSEPEIIDIILYKEGFMNFQIEKHVKIIFREESLTFRKSLFKYKLIGASG